MKPPLQVPAAFGHWLVQGSRLVCRQPRKTVTVQAPNRLLREVMALCDGSAPWPDVLARLSDHWAKDDVAAFLYRLAQENILVESSEVWAHWSDIAQVPSVTSMSAGPDDAVQLPLLAHQRLLPGPGIGAQPSSALGTLFAQRETFRTFDDQPVSVETLCSVLWAAHGVARPTDTGGAWHRTTASGGNMHSARWFVAVLRELPAESATAQPVEPGIYEAHFHRGGGASLRKLEGRSEEAWHCVSDPRSLRFASALVLPVFDVAAPGKVYGNRATFFATIEAGQCLQNAQLMATELNAAAGLRGDTVAHAVLKMARLDEPGDASHWLPMPGLIVGTRPSAAQKAQQQADKQLELTPHVRPSAPNGSTAGLSFAFAAGPAAWVGKARPSGSGRAQDPKLALTKAEAEAWERLGWSTARGLVEARLQELPGAIDPRALVAYSPRQYANAAFPFQPFAARRKHLWKEATDVATGNTAFLLAECVHAPIALPQPYQARAYTSTSTSGMAAGTSREDALHRATLELVERDAFLCAWLRGDAPPAIKPSSLPRAAARRIARLESTGMRVAVLDLSGTWAPVIAVFVQGAQPPFTAITAAADFSSEHALSKALDEAEGRIAHAQNFAPRKERSGDAMQAIERYYGNARTFGRSDFFAASAAIVSFVKAGKQCATNWDALQSRIGSDGFQLLCADLSPEGAAVQQGRAPLHVVRALIPGLVPIWFQRGTQPEAMPRFIEATGTAGARPAKFFIHPFT